MARLVRLAALCASASAFRDLQPDQGPGLPADEALVYHGFPAQWPETGILEPGERFMGNIDLILRQEVPGLGESFGQAFAELARVGCPVWLIGGAVRDLVRGAVPNDVDVALACDRSSSDPLDGLKEEYMGKLAREGEYFTLGDATALNGLEGITLSMDFNTRYFGDFTANFIFYSVTGRVIVDPTGRGLGDARAQILHPVGTRSDTQLEWDMWLVSGMSSLMKSKQQRYAKFRARGWAPSGQCFAAFMGATLAREIEEQSRPQQDPYLTLRVLGDAWLGKGGDTVAFSAYVRAWWRGLAADVEATCGAGVPSAGAAKVAVGLLQACTDGVFGGEQGDCEACQALRASLPGPAGPADACVQNRIALRGKGVAAAAAMISQLDAFPKDTGGLAGPWAAFSELGEGLARTAADLRALQDEARAAELENMRCQVGAKQASDALRGAVHTGSLLEGITGSVVPDLWSLDGIDRLTMPAINWYGKAKSMLEANERAAAGVRETKNGFGESLQRCLSMK